MIRCQCKNISSNSQETMSPLEPSNPNTAGPEYSNRAKEQQNPNKERLKTVWLKTKNILKKKINKSFNKVQGNTFERNE